MTSNQGTYGVNDIRVIVLLPKSRDAESISRVLEEMGVTSKLCATPEELCAEMERGVGALMIEEEVLSSTVGSCLHAVLESQPSWSELPIIVLLSHGVETQIARDSLLLHGDVSLVERPVRVNTLVAVVRSALRSRRRQYLVRDQLLALEQSESRYRLLFDSIDEGFCIIEMLFDENGEPVDYRFLETNPSFQKQSGLIDVQGRRMREFVPEHETHWFEIYGQVAATGEPARFQGEAAGLHRWYDVFAFRIGHPEARQVAVLFNDITERKQAEEELRAAKDELEVRVRERTEELSRALAELYFETAERLQAVDELREKELLLLQQSRLAAMGEMLVNISHQWRQPLNVLGIILQELKRRYKGGNFTGEFLDERVTRGKQIISHMSQTIDDFRNFLSLDKVKIQFNVKEVVETTLSMVRDTFTTMMVEVRITSEEDIVVEGYRNEYAQAVMNILINARDVFRERKVANPQLAITISGHKGRSLVTIADNAGGIASDVINRVFDPYFTTKPPDKGTGIGLFMSKMIIERNMGGSLSVRNSDDGAEFVIEV